MRRSNPERVYRGRERSFWLPSSFISAIGFWGPDRSLYGRHRLFQSVVGDRRVPHSVLAGIIVSLIFGFGGKWLAHLPPLIVRSVSYFALAQHMTTIAPGSSLIPIGWWGFFLILTVEFCAVGGVIGEVMVKRTYGRSALHKPVEPIGPAPR